LLFEAVDTALNNELWRSDGTDSGTYKVKEIYPGSTNGGLNLSLQNAGGTIYLAGEDIDHGIEIWTTDGTEAGTFMVCDIDTTPPSINSTPEHFFSYGGSVYFKATKDDLGDEIWQTDGTCAGTSMLINLNNGVGDGSHPDYFTNYLGIIYFTAYTDLDGPIDTELWKSDGTAAGTLLVKDIYPGIAEGLPRYLTVVNDKLCFSAKNAPTDIELWVSDGTEAGTVLLKDILGGPGGSNPQNFTLVNSTLFFTANDGINGIELWKTDGTEPGTLLVKNIRPGASSSNPSHLINAGGILYFAANNGTNGVELWKSDGTPAGTIMVEDLNPSGSSSPNHLYYAGTNLYFSATRNDIGNELFKLQICDDELATITPSGVTSFCKGESVILNANTGAGYSYQWKRNGAVISGAINSFYTATKSGEYQVEITVGSCTDISEIVSVTVFNKPNPVITNTDATNDICFDPEIKLKTNAAAGSTYQWYKGAMILAGATSNIYFATTTGNYKVYVTNAMGCNKMSTPYSIINSCREKMTREDDFILFPNPTAGEFNLFIPGEISFRGCAVAIYNSIGVLVFNETIDNSPNRGQSLVIAKSFAPGLYFVHLQAGDFSGIKQLIIE
ncbi:MAG: ELWxxDGT repeat protein, partial [Chitinophagales bacterium]